MREFYPLIFVGAVVGVLTLIFIIAYLSIKDKKEALGFDRHMKDGEITKRLLRYAKPYIPSFILVLLIMIFSISYEIISPILVGEITDMISEEFELARLFTLVGIYASILVISQICTYVQAIVLQRTG
jgi:ATP-binding cassette subfamily B protein